MTRAPATALPRFLALYAAQFGAFGAASPFLPSLLREHGVPASWLGVVLGAGTAIRLLAGPAGGRLADRTKRPVLVLTALTAAAAALALGYVPAYGFLPVLLASVAHAAVLAPITPLADTLALGSATGPRGFPYGWVRGAGSAAFIAGALAAGQLTRTAGLGVILLLNAALLALAVPFAALLPGRVAGTAAPPPPPGGAIRALLRLRLYPIMLAAAALIDGSHAMHDGFEVIRWREAGLSNPQCSVLWSLPVASEVVVFFFLGAVLLRRLSPPAALLLAAAAGMLRWITAAHTASFAAMALVEPLHGLTFALLHLACMQVIQETVPASLAATAQAVYATLALGAASALVSVVSGPLYANWGATAFWFPAALCAAAVPIALRARSVQRTG